MYLSVGVSVYGFFFFFLHTSVNGFFLSKHGYVVSENVGDEGGFFFFFPAYALLYRCRVFPRSVIDYSRSLSHGEVRVS